MKAAARALGWAIIGAAIVAAIFATFVKSTGADGLMRDGFGRQLFSGGWPAPLFGRAPHFLWRIFDLAWLVGGIGFGARLLSIDEDSSPHPSRPARREREDDLDRLLTRNLAPVNTSGQSSPPSVRAQPPSQSDGQQQ